MKKFLVFVLCVLAVVAQAKTRKAVYIIIDGVPADQIERLQPPTISAIAAEGGYARAYTGGEIGQYSQTATISAIGYTNLLTATWYNKHNVGGNSNLKPNYNYWMSIINLSAPASIRITFSPYCRVKRRLLL